MSPDLFPIVSYVLITTFTPGPSNISSASMGVLYGFRRTTTFLVGLAAGFLLVMILSGWISTTVLKVLPALESVLRYLGAAYILYLAFAILKENYTFHEEQAKPMGFVHGLVLQLLNPKLIVYAFTLFSAILAPMIKFATQLAYAILLLTLASFCATVVWALFGTAIRAYLHHPKIKTALNIAFSLLLVLTAAQLVGII